MIQVQTYCSAIAHSTVSPLWERYSACPEAHRRLLWVLSVVYEGVNQTTFKEMVDRLEWKAPSGEPLSGLMVRPLREQLLGDELISSEGNLVRCHPELVEGITREACEAGVFQQIAAVASRYAGGLGSTPQRVGPSETLIRKMRLALYGRQERELLSFLGSGAGRDNPEVLEPLLRICFKPFDREWFETLPVSIQFAVLAPLLDEAACYLENGIDAWALALHCFGETQEPVIRRWLAEQWLLRGEHERVEGLLKGDSASAALTLSGWSHFLRGENVEAIEAFRQALLLARKEARKRKPHIGGIQGIFYILALLRADAPELLDEARNQAALAVKQASNDPFEPVYRMLGDLVTIFRGERKLEESVWLGRESVAVEPYLELLRVLARRWLGGSVSPRQVSRLPRYRAAAEEGGWGWFAAECGALLKAMAAAPGSAEGGEGEGSLPFVPITRLVPPKPPWERALLALQGVSATPDPKSSGADGEELRLVWRVSLGEGGECWLEPKEQKRSKRGGWTRGRSVSLARLYEGGGDFAYLSPQDRLICQAIRPEVVFELYGRYPKTVYTFDTDQMLLAAVGHPLLFWADAPDSPVELLGEEPALEVHQEGEQLSLCLRPVPCADSQVVTLREGPRRLKVVRFNEDHRRIAEILGRDGLTVPLSARERVLESIKSIAPLLNVHSDIGVVGTAATRVDADPRPHIYIKPLNDGFFMDCYVQPFGEKGPIFRPGEGRSTVFTEVEGKPLQTVRDLEAEGAAADRLFEAAPALDWEGRWSWEVEDPEMALDTLLSLQQLGEQVVLEWPQGRKVKLSRSLGVGNISLSIRKQRDWFDLDGEIRIDSQRVISMKELLELLDRSTGRFVRLGEDEFITLTRDLRKRVEVLRDIGDGGHFHPLASTAIQELTDGMELKASKAWREQMARLEAVRNLQPELPSTLCAELRDYQLEGYHWLARLAHWGAGACLADDMGLGKTLQALAIILARADQGPTLVLAPTSVCTNWLEEAARFAPTLNVVRFGPGDRLQLVEGAGPSLMLVCSYGLLQAESALLGKVEWATIVADEAQAIKNAQTKRSRAAMALKSRFKMVTTGTPIENHLGELWNLFRFINPGLLGTLDTFNHRFAGPIEQEGNRAAKQRLKQLIRPFILRRLKSDVLTELPERTEITLHIELSEEETSFYQALRLQALDRVTQGNAMPGQRQMKILAEITRLRQACCNPRLVLEGSTIPSAKLQAFGEILEELRENRHRALVFSQFVGHLALLREYLDGRGVHYQYLDGSTPVRKRSQAVDAFQRGEGELFLISLKAGGSGLNLTAADYVIHMDPWWNPAVEDQASDRAHRIGQQRPVTVYRLVARGTIEEKIVKLHAHKRDLADNLLEGSDLSGRMSVDEMMDLLKEGAGG